MQLDARSGGGGPLRRLQKPSQTALSILPRLNVPGGTVADIGQMAPTLTPPSLRGPRISCEWRACSRLLCTPPVQCERVDMLSALRISRGVPLSSTLSGDRQTWLVSPVRLGVRCGLVPVWPPWTAGWPCATFPPCPWGACFLVWPRVRSSVVLPSPAWG